MNDLKRLVYDLMQNEPQRETGTTEPTTSLVLRNLYDHEPGQFTPSPVQPFSTTGKIIFRIPKQSSRSRFLSKKRKRTDYKALEKNHGKRKLAAKDLGISERTLYHKLKNTMWKTKLCFCLVKANFTKQSTTDSRHFQFHSNNCPS